MECPKCHSIISEKSTVCPKCHKVLLLECPNCHELGDSAVCENCGYSILIKCAKCSKINPAVNDLCSKCGFPTKTSLAYSECETDEFASVVIKFNNLNKIKKSLKTKTLFNKFYIKLKNLLFSNIKNFEGKVIIYKDNYVINFNKELSFPTSSNKAVRLAIKIVNAFSELNDNLISKFDIPLGLNVYIIKKSSEELQELKLPKNNVKMLLSTKSQKRYLKGTQIILDQYVRDNIYKDFKTDSLYSTEQNGQSVLYYEILLDYYVLPLDEKHNEESLSPKKNTINKQGDKTKLQKDLYSFKVFDINAKCSFERVSTVDLTERLNKIDFQNKGKIIALRSEPEYEADLNEIAHICKKNNLRVITVTCTENMTYRPWGLFTDIFKSYFGLKYTKDFNCNEIDKNVYEVFKPLFELCSERPIDTSSPDDARFAYMEMWSKFLSSLKNTVILIDGFENLDDTTVQTLSLYFDRFKQIVPNFIFITSDNTAVHSKIKGLLRAPVYTEFKLLPSSFDSCIAGIKSDAKDFIGSFYFDKIRENFNGSYLYFKHAYEYLKESGVLVDFENKLLVKDSKSLVIPKELLKLYKVRMKNLGKNEDVSFICAYSYLIAPNIDFEIIESLGVQHVKETSEMLAQKGIVRINKSKIVFNNFNLYKAVIEEALNKDSLKFLSEIVLSKLKDVLDDALMAQIIGNLENYKEKYLSLCYNSDFAITTGDYDAYLKNCLGFLSLLESVDNDVADEEIESRKKEVYNNILMCLYKYAPDKIYFIENILLMDAIKDNDNEKIVKLSNLMLQGALISSNYTDAGKLMLNILSRMENPTLVTDGVINTKFLLLSLVNIEILYNIGDYKNCIETAEDIINVLNPDIILKIKPANFSIGSFVEHLLDTFRIAIFAKLLMCQNDIETFLEKIHSAIGEEFPEKDAVIAIKDYLEGKIYEIGNIEEYSVNSKLIFLILQEVSQLNNDYKNFAQNIYQAKLLAQDIKQKEIELLCDILIGYAYLRVGATEKAESIFTDISNQTEKLSMFNIYHIANYFIALLKSQSDVKKAMLIINNSLAAIRKRENMAKILFVLFEKLYIKIAEENEIHSVNIDSEFNKIAEFEQPLKRLFN